MGPPVDFDLAVLILRVLEAWELGNRGLYRKYRAYKKSSKFQNSILVPGIQKTDFYDFSGNFYEKKSGIRESRVRRRFRESRVRRRFRDSMNCYSENPLPRGSRAPSFHSRFPESSSHSRFPYSGFFLVKIDFFIVKSIPGSPEKPYAPGGTKKTRLFSGQKTCMPI